MQRRITAHIAGLVMHCVSKRHYSELWDNLTQSLGYFGAQMTNNAENTKAFNDQRLYQSLNVIHIYLLKLELNEEEGCIQLN